jgi:phosphoglycerol transferase MdoB-like AlkP superfamily enzyme
VWLAIDLPFGVWLTVRLSRLSSSERLPAHPPRAAAAAALVLIAIAGAVVGAPRQLAAADLDQTFRDRAVAERLGPYGYHLYDAWNYVRATALRPAATSADVERARAWFAARAPLRAALGASAGAARGRNLIVVQVESMQDFVVDYQVGGEDVMPHLKRWTTDAVRFTDVTDQTGEGRTSDAEFTTLVSLLPLDHGAVAFRYPGNHYVGLPKVLADHGYATLSAVAFEPGFWNRGVMHPSYGFQHSLFEPDFHMTEQIGWGLNDRDFLQQMVPRLERLPKPFCAWLITLSLHHPFADFPEAHKTMRLGAREGTSFGNYLHTMRFFDDALEAFRAALEKDGLLDQSAVVVFGDHDAGFPHDPELAAAIGIRSTPEDWEAIDRIPLFVRVPGLAGVPHSIATPAGQTDFAPTLLALAGIDPSPLPYVGRNLFGAPDDPPLPRPYGDWLDGHHLFLGGSSDSARSCYATLSGRFDPPSACAAAAARANEARDISRLVVTADLQQRLR